MPIIPKDEKMNKIDLRIRIPSNLNDQILNYCAFANINDLSHFFCEAAKYVLKVDNEWKKQKKETETTTAES